MAAGSFEISQTTDTVRVSGVGVVRFFEVVMLINALGDPSMFLCATDADVFLFSLERRIHRNPSAELGCLSTRDRPQFSGPVMKLSLERVLAVEFQPVAIGIRTQEELTLTVIVNSGDEV